MNNEKINALREEMLEVALANYREGGKWAGRPFSANYIQTITKMHYHTLVDFLTKKVEADELISEQKGDVVYYQYPRFPDVAEKYRPLCWEEEVMSHQTKIAAKEKTEQVEETASAKNWGDALHGKAKAAVGCCDDGWLGYNKATPRKTAPAMAVRKNGGAFSWNTAAAALYDIPDGSTAVYRFDKDGNLQIKAVSNGTARIRKHGTNYVMVSIHLLRIVETRGHETNYVYPITIDAESGVWTVWLDDKSLGALAERERK